MKKDLKSFMENITMINKDLSTYEDSKGFYYVVGTAQLLCSVEYLELEEPQLKQLLFNQEIDKLDYHKITTKKIKVKSDITHKEKDNNTLIEADVEVNQVWVVKNQLKISKSFTEKAEALDYAKEVNKEVFNALGIEYVYGNI